MKAMRKTAALLAAAALLLTAGCESKPDASSPESADGTSSGSPSSSTQPPPPSDGYELPVYKAPDDGIDYDDSPLELNPEMGFITRQGDKLMDGDRELRFISVNGPTALDSTPFEQEDLVKAVAQMGGQVMRTYTFSVRSATEGSNQEKYILGKDEYNETAFVRLDNLLALCHKYGVRLIIPFIDPYTYNGGVPAFLSYFGIKATGDKDQDMTTFLSNDEVQASFRNFVSTVLNRTNTITGVKYKDDPAILAWESGNELSGNNVVYNKWMRELAAFLKSIDSNHLVLDGFFGVRDQALEDENIDIVSHHFYPNTTNRTFVEECRDLRNTTKDRKPAIVGEFGFHPLDDMSAMYDEAIANGIAGTLMWSLRAHDSRGGFVQHQENEDFSSYHWPGFPQGDSYEETAFLWITYLKAYEIQGKKPKLVEVPAVPSIIEPIRNPALQIKWQGSTGAYGYDFQRAESPDGPWMTIGVDISDDFHYATAMFKDKFQPEGGKTYYYRLRAKSAGGFSDWSAPVAVTVPDVD